MHPEDDRVPPTTDEDALLAAVAAAPRDDAPRLVYADWLLERGRDAQADYLRAVVTLLHAPDDRAAVGRCVELAPTIDPEWRQRVAGRFEVLMDGGKGLLWIASLLQSVINIAIHKEVGVWQPGQPLRLRTRLTREDAEAFIRTFGTNLLGLAQDEGEKPLRLLIRVTDEGADVNLVALAPGKKRA